MPAGCRRMPAGCGRDAGGMPAGTVGRNQGYAEGRVFRMPWGCRRISLVEIHVLLMCSLLVVTSKRNILFQFFIHTVHNTLKRIIKWTTILFLTFHNRYSTHHLFRLSNSTFKISAVPYITTSTVLYDLETGNHKQLQCYQNIHVSCGFRSRNVQIGPAVAYTRHSSMPSRIA
jgi:hypothetical protein